MTAKSPLPADVEIGKKIRMRRMMLGMSQQKLGDALGITFQQIQKYEKGTNRVGGSRMEQIAKELGVKPSFFFPDDMPGEAAAPSFDRVTLEIAGLAEKMTAEQRLSLRTVARAIVGSKDGISSASEAA